MLSWLYCYSVKLLYTMIVVFNQKIIAKSCNSVEFNGQNLSKLWAFVWGHDRAMLDACFFSSRYTSCYYNSQLFVSYFFSYSFSPLVVVNSSLCACVFFRNCFLTLHSPSASVSDSMLVLNVWCATVCLFEWHVRLFTVSGYVWLVTKNVLVLGFGHLLKAHLFD